LSQVESRYSNTKKTGGRKKRSRQKEKKILIGRGKGGGAKVKKQHVARSLWRTWWRGSKGINTHTQQKQN